MNYLEYSELRCVCLQQFLSYNLPFMQPPEGPVVTWGLWPSLMDLAASGGIKGSEMNEMQGLCFK